jgi:hypothetical protein
MTQSGNFWIHPRTKVPGQAVQRDPAENRRWTEVTRPSGNGLVTSNYDVFDSDVEKTRHGKTADIATLKRFSLSLGSAYSKVNLKVVLCLTKYHAMKAY